MEPTVCVLSDTVEIDGLPANAYVLIAMAREYMPPVDIPTVDYYAWGYALAAVVPAEALLLMVGTTGIADYAGQLKKAMVGMISGPDRQRYLFDPANESLALLTVSSADIVPLPTP